MAYASGRSSIDMFTRPGSSLLFALGPGGVLWKDIEGNE